MTDEEVKRRAVEPPKMNGGVVRPEATAPLAVVAGVIGFFALLVAWCALVTWCHRHGFRAAAWIVVLLPLGAIACVERLDRYRRARQSCRRSMGLCPFCGYDLRATPGRCPECGQAPVTPAG